MTTSKKPFIAVHSIHSNFDREYIASDKIDPETGARKLCAVTLVTQPKSWIEVPDSEVPRLLKLGAIREPTAEELQLRQMSQGR
jgi:hypothetical protein